ncbi:MAG: hypothetical protein ACOWWM_20260 [Desulfobacterales bacterium]
MDGLRIPDLIRSGRRHATNRPRPGLGCLAGLLCGILLSSLPAEASVVVHDAVTVEGIPVVIRVRTRTGPFASGGERVRVTVADRPEQQILTGGDGFGFWKIADPPAGLHAVEAWSRNAEGRGLLLVARRAERILLIEVESALSLRQVSGKAGSATRRVLNQLAEGHGIVCVSRSLTLGRLWLRLHDLPRVPILTGKPGNIAGRLRGMGLAIRAAVGGADFLEAVGEGVEAFSFEKTDAGRRVESWEDIQGALSP